MPDGWKGTGGLLPLIVDHTNQANIGVLELYREQETPNPDSGGDGVLSKTGAEVLAAAVLGVTALLLGLLLLRRKKPEEEDA